MVSSLVVFKVVSVVFAIASVVTGIMGIIDPVGFSKMFGIAVSSHSTKQQERSVTTAYTALMGVRQLGTAVIILVFASQEKWNEIATILAIIGILVAVTDGIYISRAGSTSGGLLHAIPGALIAALAAWVLFYSDEPLSVQL